MSSNNGTDDGTDDGTVNAPVNDPVELSDFDYIKSLYINY